MVGHGNEGEGTGQVIVRKLGYIHENVVYKSIFSKLPAERAGV